MLLLDAVYIERLWRDLYSGCVCFFYNFFHFLEDVVILNINDPLDLYCLQFIALLVIQHLNLFREGWAKHPLQTEGNRTPPQLWILGLHSMQSYDEAIDGLLNSSEVGIADNGVCSIILAHCYVVAKVCKVLYI